MLFTPHQLGAVSLEHRVLYACTTCFRSHFKGWVIAPGGFEREGAEAIRQRGDADLVAYGRPFSLNPDLTRRLKHNPPLTPYVRKAFGGGDERQYTDFPPHNESHAMLVWS